MIFKLNNNVNTTWLRVDDNDGDDDDDDDDSPLTSSYLRLMH